MKSKEFLLYLIILACFFFLACEGKVYTPKPRGYFRIDIQDTTYTPLKGLYPYFFEYSNLAFVDSLRNREQYWVNLVYPDLNAVLHITYKSIDTNNLTDLINDSRTMAIKQIAKADDILESHILDSATNLYGKIYETVGNDAACTFQFWVTDRENHFLRASLYLNHVPQNDSLAPIISYLKKDMMHLIETFRWNKIK
jgi:gliding motility-associated lipoprotein GldD